MPPIPAATRASHHMQRGVRVRVPAQTCSPSTACSCDSMAVIASTLLLGSAETAALCTALHEQRARRCRSTPTHLLPPLRPLGAC